jgi:hypothetical protein
MLIPKAFSKPPLPLATALSIGPTQQSKLSQPGSSGFSASAAFTARQAQTTSPETTTRVVNARFIMMTPQVE